MRIKYLAFALVFISAGSALAMTYTPLGDALDGTGASAVKTAVQKQVKSIAKTAGTAASSLAEKAK